MFQNYVVGVEFLVLGSCGFFLHAFICVFSKWFFVFMCVNTKLVFVGLLSNICFFTKLVFISLLVFFQCMFLPNWFLSAFWSEMKSLATPSSAPYLRAVLLYNGETHIK